MLSTSKNIWNFDPRSVPGCAVWFDAADTSTITGSSTVTAWKDKSRNAWNATTLIGTAPTRTTVNGLNAVSFAASSVLTVSNVTFTSVQSRAIFVVYRVPASGNYISWFSTQAFNINNQGGHNNYVYPLGGGGPYLQSYAVGGAVQGMGADPAVSTIGSTAIACMIHSAVSTSRNTVTLNGTSYTLSTNTLASGYGSGTVTYYIGNAYPLAYILCEYILYQEEFNITQRQQIEGYLAHKWGIKTSLPTTHPFYSIKPFLRQFSPVDISNCELWFDGADYRTMFQNVEGTSNVTTSNQSVARWNDKIKNISISNTGNSGQTTLAPSSASGGGIFFNNSNSAINNSQQGLATLLTGASNQTAYLFRLPSKDVTMIIASYPLSNNNYRQVCAINSVPIGSAVPNIALGLEVGAVNGGTMLFDWNGSSWGQIVQSTSGYNSNTVLRIDSLIADSNAIWLTNGTSNTFTQTNTYTSTNSNYPVNAVYMGAYSSTVVGARNFHGTIYEMLLYSKILTTAERQQVEGYLAQKWGVRTSFPSTFPFKTLPPSSALPFLPTNFSGCSLWLDPPDRSTVTLNGSNVSQLNDKSGLGYNMSQATSGNQPTYSNSLYGNSMLKFTQSSSTRLSNTAFPAFIGAGPASYFLVEYNMTAPSGNPSPFGYSAGPNSGLIMQYNAGFTGGLQPFSTGISSFTSATPRLIFLYKPNVTSSNMTGFINGTSQTVSDTTSGTYSGTFRVGSGINGFISGNICELIVFNRSLTTSERQQIEGYLAYKWRLTTSLPSLHPYKNFQPAQTRIIVPSTIATVTLSALSGSSGTITWTTSTNAVSYKWFVGTTFPTSLVSGTVGDVLTASVSYAFAGSTNYFGWVTPVSSTGTDGSTTISSSASNGTAAPVLYLWLDASDLSTLFQNTNSTSQVTTSGQTVRAWNDKSGNLRHYTGSTGPTYTTATAGSKQTVLFSVNGQSLVRSGLPAGSRSLDFFVVTQPSTSTGDWRTLFRGASTDHHVLIEQGSYRLGAYYNQSIGFTQFGSLTLNGSSRVLLHLSISSTGVHSASLNGNLTMSAASGTSGNDSIYYLGSIGGQLWGGISEVRVYTTNLTNAQKSTIFSELNTKWSIY